MGRHQTIGQNLNYIFVTVLFKPTEIEDAILVIKKDGVAPVSPLSDMVGQVSKYGSLNPRHLYKV
jgi:hypothetical protein